MNSNEISTIKKFVDLITEEQNNATRNKLKDLFYTIALAGNTSATNLSQEKGKRDYSAQIREYNAELAKDYRSRIITINESNVKDLVTYKQLRELYNLSVENTCYFCRKHRLQGMKYPNRVRCIGVTHASLLAAESCESGTTRGINVTTNITF